MKHWRLAALAFVAVGLAPGTWIRSAPPADRGDALFVTATRLEVATPKDWPEGLTIAALWQLTGDHPDFGGFSAMVAGAHGGFTLFSDLGRMLDLPSLPDAAPEGTVSLGPLALPRVPAHPEIRQVFDIESAYRDPDSGTVWLGYEYHNAIQRIGAKAGDRPAGADRPSDLVKPPQMAGWGDNSGAESMVRLADGRFLVLAERGGIGLRFAGDPLENPPVEQFMVQRFDDFLPTDMTQMPDGRVLVLLRATRWHVPPFATMLALGDPATIAAGEEWRLTPLLAFDRADLRDNYEAVAVEPEEDGALAIWLVSDDNRSVLQRNLVLKLRWLEP